jgi:flagellar hook-associated protein 3 FlgL
LGSLSSLVTALQSGNATAIGTATTAVSAALSNVSQQRVFYGNAESQLNSQETALQQETVSLTSQQSSLVDVDEAQAATDLSQAETANNAAEAAAAKVLPQTLLNYLVPTQ